MTATDELRRMLDERGVEWDADDEAMDDGSLSQVTYWYSNDIEWSADGRDGYLAFDAVQLITPEQAIAATLGAEDKVYAVGGIIAQAECHDVCNSAAEFTCSACGFNCDITSWISLFDGDVGKHRHHHHGTPNYCPNCGRRVVP